MVKDYGQAVSKTLKELGFSAGSKGYNYTCEALLHVIENPRSTHRLSHEIYPVVAKTNDTTPTRTERAIRHAIKTAFERMAYVLKDDTMYQAVFGCALMSKPTPRRFLATVAEYIKEGDYDAR